MANAAETSLQVEIVWALPQAATRIALQLPAGATVGQAIRASGLLERHPEIDLARNPVGVFGERVQLDDCLRDGDRVEIYRPLTADPAATRRARAASQARRRK